MIFSDKFHIGTMICNFGHLENLTNLESIVNLFNMSLVELVESQIKDRIIYFNFISNKDLNFNNYLKKKTVKNDSSVISSTIKNILNAKLQKFRNKNIIEISNKTNTSTNSNKNIVKIGQDNNNQIRIPNVNFDKKEIFKKSFSNFIKIAEEIRDGEIIYKI